MLQDTFIAKEGDEWQMYILFKLLHLYVVQMVPNDDPSTVLLFDTTHNRYYWQYISFDINVNRNMSNQNAYDIEIVSYSSSSS